MPEHWCALLHHALLVCILAPKDLQPLIIHAMVWHISYHDIIWRSDVTRCHVILSLSLINKRTLPNLLHHCFAVNKYTQINDCRPCAGSVQGAPNRTLLGFTMLNLSSLNFRTHQVTHIWCMNFVIAWQHARIVQKPCSVISIVVSQQDSQLYALTKFPGFPCFFSEQIFPDLPWLWDTYSYIHM